MPYRTYNPAVHAVIFVAVLIAALSVVSFLRPTPVTVIAPNDPMFEITDPYVPPIWAGSHSATI